VKTRFLASFARDLRKVRDVSVQEQIRSAILQVEAAEDLRSISHLKKLSGTAAYFRIRVGDYRVGVHIEGDTVTFVRVLPRRDIYRYFP
jgi:mRNA interferase RelE/StbE